MPAAPLPDNEVARLRALRDLELLDSESDIEFEALAKAAAAACDAPISLLSLVDESRQWFKSSVGLDGTAQTHRDAAFCAYAIHTDEILEVEDATKDERFADNVLVTGDPNIRFYAGAPLKLSTGHRVGTLCVIGREPRALSPQQREILKHLAQAAVIGMERRKQARARVIAHAEKLVLAEELEMENLRKSNFLASLAHELRGPLGAMTTGLHFLSLAPGANEAQKKTFSMLRRQVSQMSTMVGELMDISSISKGKLHLKLGEVDLNAVIASAVETCLPLIEARQHEVIFALSESPLRVQGDFGRLVQVVSNLLTNAAKYTPSGGRITIASWEEPEHASIEVGDNGVGITQDALEGVFVMFRQIETSSPLAQGGLGIGLALVRQLVDLHGGTVTAQSEGSGKGSQFKVSLPGLRPALQ